MATVVTKTFDPAAYLNDDEVVAEYLTQVMKDGTTGEFLMALGHVAQARGMKQVAELSGLGRESLYKVFAPGAKPRFDTVMRIVHAVGFKLNAHAS
ncbi:MAG: putative addiction module antidote protein [Magnetococcales bacterium]|nr:putative addiction module antidote protein [Magnetococcales bacterium]